ncbi:mycofactocin-coupled SDR family oxidoreductase [Sporichthya sp.]|uniref:mycofactocin-coupled SDR family oxidoreductase n=1 Tax=Sporichthya sp. TaxID=65475 RepID=UPI001799B03A|nr:mycofactocin-coupled SDR family oxidoreductase [Sporichthya sp.]MBA3742837.1 mycofactocin-coupled SDR family oxidoreductase [Sporichthya sp.]
MGRVSGKVALITGAARGQGRAHAVRLAEEGADIIAVDVCSQLGTVPYGLATPEDLVQTTKLVEEHDRRVIARQVDVRDLAGLQQVVADGVDELGGIDIVVANAGIGSFAPVWELTEEQWNETVDVNLTGVWKTVKAAIPSMIEAGKGGSIILTSSLAGLVAFPNLGHYTAAKHGVTGLMRNLAVELAPYNIRANSLHPAIVHTDMTHNDAIYQLFLPHLSGPSRAEAEDGYRGMHGLNISGLEPIDIANMVLFLASDESRYITGTTQVLDAGGGAPFKIPHM